MTVALAFFMAYIGLMVGAAKGEFRIISARRILLLG
jgi:DNA mismatch repair ATPase MutS